MYDNVIVYIILVTVVCNPQKPIAKQKRKVSKTFPHWSVFAIMQIIL